MDGYVTKPLRTDELHAAIAQLTGPVADEGSAVAPANGEGRVLDADALIRVTSSNRTLLREIVGLFGAEAARYVGDMRAALRAGDLAPLRAMAHALKGSAGSLAAERVAQLARELEGAISPIRATSKPCWTDSPRSWPGHAVRWKRCAGTGEHDADRRAGTIYRGRPRTRRSTTVTGVALSSRPGVTRAGADTSS